jgi:hypothetical protein
MGCVHTHWWMYVIERWGSPSRVQNAMQKIGEDNWKVKKIGQIVSQAFTPGLEHDKIHA